MIELFLSLLLSLNSGPGATKLSNEEIPEHSKQYSSYQLAKIGSMDWKPISVFGPAARRLYTFRTLKRKK
jgi:hypothetical protein